MFIAVACALALIVIVGFVSGVRDIFLIRDRKREERGDYKSLDIH